MHRICKVVIGLILYTHTQQSVYALYFSGKKRKENLKFDTNLVLIAKKHYYYYFTFTQSP